MKNKINAFNSLAKIFKSHGYNIYLVGGTVRDFLMHNELDDIDLATDATPSEMETFIKEYIKLDKYKDLGSIVVKYQDVKFDITTFRKERAYSDYRHPKKITFIKDIKKDSKRRDFTINAMYLDDHFKLIDFYGGKQDIENRLIRMVGNPSKRIKEDPLRILRALRFALMYSCTIEDKLLKVMIKKNFLIDNLSKEKIKQEIKKIKGVNEDLKISLFSSVGLKYLLEEME